MNEEYLWDRSGEPDPDTVRLEQLLGQLGWSETRRNFAQPRSSRSASWWQHGWWLKVAAAAIVVLGIGAAVYVRKLHSVGPVTTWQLSLAGGDPRATHAGQVIDTTGVTHGIMKSELVGEVDIQPNSRLRLLSARRHEERLALDRGTIHALIWAPPARFVVDTPSAQTIDLGCQYTLHVANDGTGFLTVETGWVAFQWHNIESFIPAGAACVTRPGHGPDTPHYLDAPEALIKAVAQYDLTQSQAELNTALSAARPRDGLTLWHLLQRTKGAERAEVFDRFAELVNLPPAVTREAILRGDRNSFDAAWDALQLGDTSWWREWKRQW